MHSEMKWGGQKKKGEGEKRRVEEGQVFHLDTLLSG